MDDRKLATLRTVDNVFKHPNADSLDIVQIGGWQCVSKIGTFKTGDVALYLEIDSFVPIVGPFKFLENKAIKWDGREGARIKTIKLRGELSQGLALPPSEFPEFDSAQADPDFDWAPMLGVVKWEKALPACLGGTARGNFPSFLRKTDQERIQNLWAGFGKKDETYIVSYEGDETGHTYYAEKHHRYTKDTPYEVTTKLDGSSMTVYFKDGDFGVCSRNLDLVETEGNTFWKVANNANLREKLTIQGMNIALQGELMGPGVQDNPEKLADHEFYLFDVFDINTGKYWTAADRVALAHAMQIEHVPVLGTMDFNFEMLEDALAYAEGASLFADNREGVVWKSIENPDFSFKVISNKYLLAEK